MKAIKNESVKKLQTITQKKHYKHEALNGIIAGVDKPDRELIDEYLEEKYGLKESKYEKTTTSCCDFSDGGKP